MTPFRAAMGRVVWGLCLTSVTLNFWYLSYLLPALGTMLLVLGLRSLRRNNIWFRFCWFISIYQVIYLYGNTALAATPFSLDPDWLPLWLRGLAFLAKAAVLFLCLWRGLVRAADEVGQPRRAAAPALWALGWYAVVALLGVLWPQPGWAVGLAMLAAFVCIVHSLLRLSAALDGWGLRRPGRAGEDRRRKAGGGVPAVPGGPDGRSSAWPPITCRWRHARSNKLSNPLRPPPSGPISLPWASRRSGWICCRRMRSPSSPPRQAAM